MRQFSFVVMLLRFFSVVGIAQGGKSDCAGKPPSFSKNMDGFYIESWSDSQTEEYTSLTGNDKMQNEKFQERKILQAHIKAAKGIRGKIVIGSNDAIFLAIHQGKEFWIHIAAAPELCERWTVDMNHGGKIRLHETCRWASDD